MTKLLCAAACAVFCLWLFDAKAKPDPVSAVRVHQPIPASYVAVEQSPPTAEYETAASAAVALAELYGPPAPVRRDTKAEMSAADIARIDHVRDATEYLIKTATRGFTMHKQGMEVSIGYMQPECRVRFAKAIREARANGLPGAGIFSGYRIPALGVGGMPNKEESTHAAGLAGDVAGIGRPGSKEAHKWARIAGLNKLNVVYGPNHRWEWNHTQCTDVKVMRAGLPVRKTYTRAGPSAPEKMFAAAALLLRPTVLIPKSAKPPVRYAKKLKKTRYARHKRHRIASAD